MNNQIKSEKKFDFSLKKKCFCNSLKEVNYFLYNINKFCFIKKIFKKF